MEGKAQPAQAPRVSIGGKLRRHSHLLVGTVASAVSLGILYGATEPWRVFSNDYRPFLWAIPAFIGAFCIAFAARHRPVLLMLLILLVPLLVFARQRIINGRLRDSVTSCANHSSFWASLHFEGTEPLPETTEFAEFLMDHHDEDSDSDSMRGKRCPSYKRLGTKTGVAFVGGGLRLSSLRNNEVLVAFCSWNSHPPPFDHQHCLVWDWPDSKNERINLLKRECSDTKDMVERIKRALKQADEGVVPYSKAARLLLVSELETRQNVLVADEISKANKK